MNNAIKILKVKFGSFFYVDCQCVIVVLSVSVLGVALLIYMKLHIINSKPKS